MNNHFYPDLTARQLRAVLAVAENRSFIAGAAALKVSQPSLTRTIKLVERELGVTLFDRTTRQVSITPAGREFAAVAERLLNDLQISVESVRRHGAQPAGQIIVSSVLSLAGAVMPNLLSTFGKRYPGIQVHLRESIQMDVVDEVRAGVADFGIGFAEDVPAMIEVDHITNERFHVVMPHTHPLAERRRIPLEALAKTDLVSFSRESRSRRIVDSAADRRGLALHYTMTTNRLPTLLSLVRNGIGLAVVPESECPSAIDRMLIARPLAGREFVCRLGVMRSKERVLSSAAAIFLVVVRRWLAARRT